jgi:hypothetical protein
MRKAAILLIYLAVIVLVIVLALLGFIWVATSVWMWL